MVSEANQLTIGLDMLDLEKLRSRSRTANSSSICIFLGTPTAKDGKVSKSCFSQWYESPFVIDKIVYQTAEHWMMASKARLFGDDESLAKILESSDPKTAKALAEL